jgi:hypothetical protein
LTGAGSGLADEWNPVGEARTAMRARSFATG